MAGGVLTIHNEPSGLGLYINIHDAASGTDYIYGHLQEVSIQDGQTVIAGDIIGKTGSSGNAGGTPPHVHIAIKENGLRVDPLPYFATEFDPSTGSATTPCY
jgi:murein DD-endopeptidase MepM/ murein hydrolase activator NlpD